MNWISSGWPQLRLPTAASTSTVAAELIVYIKS
jgi:hypothetical protein